MSIPQFDFFHYLIRLRCSCNISVMSIQKKAFAKVNLALRVLPKKAGAEFHQIESLFQTVDFCDELEVDFAQGSGLCFVDCSLPLPADNTILRTYQAFCDFTGFSRSVNVRVKKHIPSGGGLGGGSSDSAGVLRSLCELYDFKMEKTLADFVASRVGSDVFFFLNVCGGQGSALVSGRGEIVTEIKMRKLFFVLVFPPVFSSTKEAYSDFDKKGETLDFLPFSSYENEYNSPIQTWRFKNSFTPILTAQHFEIAQAISILKEFGAIFCDMSGSGSTVFGIFENKDEAEQAAEKIVRKKMNCVCA